MVKKTDLMELKKLYKKETCHIQRMAGVYVSINDSQNKEIRCQFSRTFLNLDEDEFYKYLDIAKKTISGPIGENILEQPFQKGSQMQKLLLGLRQSKLNDNGLIEAAARRIMDEYDYKGNYLILLYFDEYDVPVKTTDKMKLDESEEVYSYIICSICPVTLSKPGLGYRKDTNDIGVLERDWVIDVPENGFLFPSFADRSTDIDTVTVYTKDKKNPYGEFLKNILECKGYMTTQQQRQVFTEELKAVFMPETDEDDTTTGEAQVKVEEIIESIQEISEDDPETEFSPKILEKVLEEKDIPKAKAKEISQNISKQLTGSDESGVKLQNLVSVPKKAEVKKKEKVVEDYEPEDKSGKTIYLTLPPGQADNVRTEEKDGKKIIVIEVSDDDIDVRMNGKLL